MTTLPKHIVFIDGDCILCNRAVIQIDERDSTKILHYASLTSDTAKDQLPAALTEKQKTFVFLVDGKIKVRSEALLCVLMTIDAYPLLQTLLKYTPTVISDFVYKNIATRRTWLSRKLKSCPFDAELSRRVLQ